MLRASTWSYDQLDSMAPHGLHMYSPLIRRGQLLRECKPRFIDLYIQGCVLFASLGARQPWRGLLPRAIIPPVDPALRAGSVY